MRYASTALSAATGSFAEIHGSVALSSFGVSGSDDYLDATGVDWGDASGPSPIGTGVGYSGDGVLVAGWKGWVQPTPKTPTSYTANTSNQCARIAFIGARGSGEGVQLDADPAFTNPDNGWDESDYNNVIGSRVAMVLKGLTTELTAHNSNASVKVLGVPYRALGVVSNPVLRMIYDANYFDSIEDGVVKTIGMIRSEYNSCHDTSERIVLSGYSQGALVIHLALNRLANSGSLADSDALAMIAGVALVSDPAKVMYGGESLLEAYDASRTDNAWAGTGVSKAEGIYTKYVSSPDNGDLPYNVATKTISMCRNHDPVCAPPSKGWMLDAALVTSIRMFGLDMHLHTDCYYKTRTDVLGRWIADNNVLIGQSFNLNEPGITEEACS